tara:strand:+ start:142 stop:555 length:414 start_codon:yes stop_codon:yes gene_type:complete
MLLLDSSLTKSMTIPIHLVRFLKTNINDLKLSNSKIYWQKTHTFKNIANKYFNYNNYNYKNYNENKYGEIMKIYNYPIAMFIINNENQEKLMVENILLNENLINLYDCGKIIRKSFYKKFNHISLKNSLNKDLFLTI